MDQGQSSRAVARPLDGHGLDVGRRVSVWNRFDDTWSGGFEIAELVDEADRLMCRLRRLSDRFVLPRLFDIETLQPEG